MFHKSGLCNTPASKSASSEASGCCARADFLGGNTEHCLQHPPGRSWQVPSSSSPFLCTETFKRMFMLCLGLAFIQVDTNLGESILLRQGLVFHLSDRLSSKTMPMKHTHPKSLHSHCCGCRADGKRASCQCRDFHGTGEGPSPRPKRASSREDLAHRSSQLRVTQVPHEELSTGGRWHRGEGRERCKRCMCCPGSP